MSGHKGTAHPVWWYPSSLLKNNTEIKAGFREYLFEGIQETSHILFLPNLDDLDAEDDALVGLEKLPGLSDFLDQVPTIDLTPNQVQYIRVEEFDIVMERLEKLTNEVQQLKEEKEAENEEKVSSNSFRWC